jgi:outer membrane protein
MKRGIKGGLTIFIFSLWLSAGAQQKHEMSVKDAVAYATKNNVLVKNALVGVQIQHQTNREITAAAYPQINANINTSYAPNVTVQTLPNFIAAGTYGVLSQEGVVDRNGNSIKPPTDIGFIEAQFGTKFNTIAGVSLQQLLFEGQVFVGLQARRASIEFAEKNVAVTEENIKANIYKIYYQLAAGKNQIEIIDANVSRLEKLLNDTRKLV